MVKESIDLQYLAHDYYLYEVDDLNVDCLSVNFPHQSRGLDYFS